MTGGGFAFDEDAVRKRSAAAFDRAFHPEGRARQTAAIASDGNRVERLKQVDTPTLVIHGAQDPLFPVECGKDIAASVPDAELVIIKGMATSCRAAPGLKSSNPSVP